MKINVSDDKYWYWTYRNDEEERLKIGFEYCFNWSLYEKDVKALKYGIQLKLDL